LVVIVIRYLRTFMAFQFHYGTIGCRRYGQNKIAGY